MVRTSTYEFVRNIIQSITDSEYLNKVGNDLKWSIISVTIFQKKPFTEITDYGERPGDHHCRDLGTWRPPSLENTRDSRCLGDKGLVFLGRKEGISGKRLHNGELLFNVYRVSVWDDKKKNSGDGCHLHTTLYLMLLNYALKNG